MKVVFLSPPQENLGIEYLSAALVAAGFETSLVVDPMLFAEPGFLDIPTLSRMFSSRDEVLARIVAARPGMLCISVTTDYFAWAKSWAAEVKRRLDVPVVFGGMHPTSVPERVAREECVDYVCVGEGDEAIVELARTLRDGGEALRIPNIWTRCEGRVVSNPTRPPIVDLDSLSMPDKGIFRSASPIFEGGYLAATGRGCPLSCSYCCNDVYHSLYGARRFLRRRSASHVLAELREAANLYRPPFIHFADDVFNYDPRWLREFLPRYKAEIGLPFSCYVYPDLADGEQARLLKDAGCFKAQLGMQIGDDSKRLRIFHRPSTNRSIERAIRAFKRAGIYVVTDNILGVPGDGEEDLVSLLRFYDRAMPDNIEIFFLRCYPRSALTRWAVENGHLDAAGLEAIERGDSRLGLFGRSDIASDSAFLGRMALLMGVYPLIPSPLRAAILRFRLFRWLPPLPRIPVMIATRILNHARYDFNAMRAWRRFSFFVGERLSAGGWRLKLDEFSSSGIS